jgi:hypothetical protein
MNCPFCQTNHSTLNAIVQSRPTVNWAASFSLDFFIPRFAISNLLKPL